MQTKVKHKLLTLSEIVVELIIGLTILNWT